MSRKHVSTRRRLQPRGPGRPPLPFVPAGRHLDNPTGCRHPGSAERGLRPAPAELRGQPGPDRFPGQLPVPRRRLLAVPDPHQGRALAEAGRHEQRRRHEGRRGQPRVPRRGPRQAGGREQLLDRQRPVEVAHRHPQLRPRSRTRASTAASTWSTTATSSSSSTTSSSPPAPIPARSGWRSTAARSGSLDAQGNLVLHTSGGDVVEHAPVVYQEINGSAPGGRRPVRPRGQRPGGLPGRPLRPQQAAGDRPGAELLDLPRRQQRRRRQCHRRGRCRQRLRHGLHRLDQLPHEESACKPLTPAAPATSS